MDEARVPSGPLKEGLYDIPSKGRCSFRTGHLKSCFSQAGGVALAGTTTRQPANPCAAKVRKLEQGRVDVLSDTQGIDFGPYLTRAIKTVRDSRYSLIPPLAYPPPMMPGRVAIEFAIQSDGTIKSEKVEVLDEDKIRLCRGELQSLVCVHPDVTLDQAAFAKDISALRFDPLPKDYFGSSC